MDRVEYEEKKQKLLKHMKKVIDDQKYEITQYFATAKMKLPLDVRNKRMVTETVSPRTIQRREFEGKNQLLLAHMKKVIEEQKKEVDIYYSKLREEHQDVVSIQSA